MTNGVAEKNFRLNNFDLLRILAALQVVVEHSLRHLQLEAPAPWDALLMRFPGVPIFFMISGFLVSMSYERSASLPMYVRARCLRIYPALWGCLLATMVVVHLSSGISFVNWQTVPWLLCQAVGLTYTPGFLQPFGFGSYNGSLWSITVEIQFYLLLPLIYALVARRKRANLWIAALFGVSFVVALILGSTLDPPTSPQGFGSKLIRYTFLPYCYMFLLGVLAQRVGLHRSPFIRGKGVYWLALYLLVCYGLPDSEQATVCSRVVLAVCILSLAYTRPQTADELLRGNDISYGVYLYHGLILNVWVEKHKLHQPMYLPATMALACIIGYLSWRLIERPMLRRKNRADVVVFGSSLRVPQPETVHP